MIDGCFSVFYKKKLIFKIPEEADKYRDKYGLYFTEQVESYSKKKRDTRHLY